MSVAFLETESGCALPAVLQRVAKKYIGRNVSLTRERIRQIEAKALRKLRTPALSKNLRDYL